MLWQDVKEIPYHLSPTRWRCPDCGSQCAKVGTPQIVVQSPLVSGGEFLTFECGNGHRVRPRAEHFGATK